MNRLLSLLFLFVLGWLQGSANAQGAESAKRQCRIIYFQAPSNAPQALYLFDGLSSQQVELPNKSLSDPYTLPQGDLILRLSNYAIVPPAQADPRMPSVAIPATLTDFYLLVSTDSQNSSFPIKMQAVDASSSVFKNGEMLWFNLTEKEVGGKVGSKRLAMKPRSKTVVEAPADSSEQYLLELGFRIPTEAEVRPLCRVSWQHDSRTKTIVFIFNEEGRRAPRLSGISDFRPVENDPPQ